MSGRSEMVTPHVSQACCVPRQGPPPSVWCLPLLQGRRLQGQALEGGWGGTSSGNAL